MTNEQKIKAKEIVEKLKTQPEEFSERELELAKVIGYLLQIRNWWFVTGYILGFLTVLVGMLIGIAIWWR